MLSFVAAISENYVIGREGTLPWYLPEDLKKFKEITSSQSKTMIMGRKTFESLPKILPGRKHIVLTSNPDYKIIHTDVKVVHNLEDLSPYINNDEEYFVIGGGEVFKTLLPYAKRIYLTIIHEKFEGDTYFPAFDKSKWKVTECYEGRIDEKNKYKHTYLTLDAII